MKYLFKESTFFKPIKRSIGHFILKSITNRYWYKIFELIEEAESIGPTLNDRDIKTYVTNFLIKYSDKSNEVIVSDEILKHTLMKLSNGILDSGAKPEDYINMFTPGLCLKGPMVVNTYKKEFKKYKEDYPIWCDFVKYHLGKIYWNISAILRFLNESQSNTTVESINRYMISLISHERYHSMDTKTADLSINNPNDFRYHSLPQEVRANKAAVKSLLLYIKTNDINVALSIELL